MGGRCPPDAASEGRKTALPKYVMTNEQKRQFDERVKSSLSQQTYVTTLLANLSRHQLLHSITFYSQAPCASLLPGEGDRQNVTLNAANTQLFRVMYKKERKRRHHKA